MAPVIKDKKQGKRQNSKTDHYAATRWEGTESSAAGVETRWREKMLGKLPAEECKLSCSLLPRIYGPWGCAHWLLLRALTAPQQRKKHTATGNITEMELFGALGCGSSNWAGAEGRSFFKDNNIMTLLRHSNLAVPNWALWTVLHQSCLCVSACGWVHL